MPANSDQCLFKEIVNITSEEFCDILEKRGLQYTTSAGGEKKQDSNRVMILPSGRHLVGGVVVTNATIFLKAVRMVEANIRCSLSTNN